MVEKAFLKKYWWVFVLTVVLSVGAGILIGFGASGGFKKEDKQDDLNGIDVSTSFSPLPSLSVSASSSIVVSSSPSPSIPSSPSVHSSVSTSGSSTSTPTSSVSTSTSPSPSPTPSTPPLSLECPPSSDVPSTFLLDLRDIDVQEAEIPTLDLWRQQGRTDRIWQFYVAGDIDPLNDVSPYVNFSDTTLVANSNFPGFFNFPFVTSAAAVLSYLFGNNTNQSSFWPGLNTSIPLDMQRIYTSARENEEFWSALIQPKEIIRSDFYSSTTQDPDYWGTVIEKKGMYTFRYKTGELVDFDTCVFNFLVIESKSEEEHCNPGFFEVESLEAVKSWCNCYDTCGKWVDGVLCEGWDVDSAVNVFELLNCAAVGETKRRNLTLQYVLSDVGSSWLSAGLLSSFADILFHGVCLPPQPTQEQYAQLINQYSLEASIALIAPDGNTTHLPSFDISEAAFHVFTNYSYDPFFQILAGWLGSEIATFSEAAGNEWFLDIAVHVTKSVSGNSSDDSSSSHSTEQTSDSCLLAFTLECPSNSVKTTAVSGDGLNVYTYCVCDDSGVPLQNEPLFYNRTLYAYNAVPLPFSPISSNGWNVTTYALQDFGCTDTIAQEESLHRCLQSCAADSDCVGVNFGYQNQTNADDCTPLCGKALSSEYADLNEDLSSWKEGQAYEVLRKTTSSACVNFSVP